MKTKMGNRKCAFGTGISGIGSKITVPGVVGDLSSDLLMNEAIAGIANLLSPKDHSGVLGDSINDTTGSNFIMAMGGQVGNIPVEVEGGEVAELPTEELLNFKGASHEAGGIDVDLPQGTNVFSDRLTMNGKTMADRKKARESKIKKLDKYLATDTIAKNGNDRTKKALANEEELDLVMQDVAGKIFNAPKRKLAFGVTDLGEDDPTLPIPVPVTSKGDYWDQVNGVPLDIPLAGSVLPYRSDGIHYPQDVLTSNPDIPLTTGITQRNGVVNRAKFERNGVVQPYTIPMPKSTVTPPVEDTGIGFTPGDITGMVGNFIGGVAPLAATIANRAGDKPNINAFQNFGVDAINTNKRAMGTVKGISDNALQDITLQETGARARNRNSARSVNTLRALDTVTDIAGDQASNGVYDSFAKQMMSLLGQESQLENIQDNAVMTGNQRKDQADRADRDNFFTNLGQNLVNLSNSTQKTGKDLNTKKQNEDFLDLLPDISKYQLGYEKDKNGKWVMKKQ